jgi:CDP-glycerol glycerophosphotransferase (TagB/SpsB family)/glycosyltransferase involved in cell wall biosynthesis
MMPRIIEEIKESVYKATYLYSADELREFGINPNLIVFLSRPDFSDNTFALWEYITKNTSYETAWLLLNGEHSAKLTEKGIANAVYNTPEGRELGRKAKIYVNNTDISYLQKYPGQLFINLWHGSGVKALDYIVFNEDNPRLKSIKCVVEEFDLHLVHSHVDKINMASEYFCDARKFIATGQPRLDRVKNATGKDNIAKLFDGALSKYENIILYAPTHRVTSTYKDGDFFSSNVFNIDDYNEQEFNRLLHRFNAAFVTKLHPIDSAKFKHDDLKLGANGYLLTDDDLFYADLQMNDILNAFDIMIADYSSIVTDFMLLDRPIIYLIGDFDTYSKNKGFVYNDISFYMPGDKATDFNTLLNALENAFVDPNRHSEWRKTVFRQKSTFFDNNACERVLRAIENYKPLTDYGEQNFIEKILIPIAEKYEEMIATLSAPSISKSELKKRTVISALESLCDDILENYPSEYVFFSPPQRWNWNGKTPTMLQQIAVKIADMGHLFLLGKTKDIPFGVPAYPLAVSEYPSADKKTDRLIILDYCHNTEVVLNQIRKHRKKAIFIVSSDFLDIDEKIMELGSSLAYRTVYLNRYQVKNYLGMKNHNGIDIARWEAYKYACRNENIIFIACNEALCNFAKEEAGTKEIFIQSPGVDYAMFSKNRNQSNIPEKLKEIKKTGKPIIGYCGTMDGRLYFSIIHYICGVRPDYQFVFVGANRIKSTWGHIFEDYPNIHLIDEVEYKSVPDVMETFDVAMIPYFKNAYDRNPSKFFEYFACGKPVVATNMAIAEKYEHLFSGDSHGDFVNRLDEALLAKDDANIKLWTAKIAEENDWRYKMEQILNWIGI